MQLTRKGKISYFNPGWEKRGGVVAGFSTRNGGISRPPYNSLNLGMNTDDLPANVEGNRTTLARALGAGGEQLLTVSQVHGDDVLVIDSPNYDLRHFQRVECDAIVCNQPDLLLAVLVADCYPVLLWDPQAKVVAAVHVGWKGAVARLLEKVVKTMRDQFGCHPDQLLAAVGPGIGGHLYQVDRPVREAFVAAGHPWGSISREQAASRWLLDLQRCCELQLETVGVRIESTSRVEECTCCHRELLFSHRRDKGTTGRQAGFIMLT
ncbi:MAG: peptidoglycan editing factor PgeF [Desulfuromonas sp.]|nr:MAG: peptidoglycan editing factor PgeF [Desulfuromonas sp.]